MPLFELVSQTWWAAFGIAAKWFWLIAPIVFGVVLWNSWLYYIRIRTLVGFKWILLEIYLPPEVEKTPLAMEQIYAMIQAALYKGSWWKRYMEGRVQEWFSVELVSLEGKLHFYIRLVDQFRNLVESAIYAQYPQAEIYEAEDYTANVPNEIPNESHNLFGAEFVLDKPDAYPIRFYSEFEFETKDGVANVDPLAGITEAMSKLKEGEQFWIQVGIKPANDDWKKEGEEILLKLIGRAVPEKQKSYVLALLKKELGDYISGALQAPLGPPQFEPFQFGPAKSDKPHSLMQFLTPGEQDVVKAIERKLSKVGFENVIRIIYVARQEVFSIHTFFSVVSGLRQFSTQNLNAIKWNSSTLTAASQPFKKRKEIFRKKWLLYKYRLRYRPAKMNILNIEELATLFHFPGRVVASPTLPRIQAKKGEPPAGLPTL